MKLFGKIRYINGVCHFCRDLGLTLGTTRNDGTEVVICDECAAKLISGISTALEELEKVQALTDKKKELETETKPEETPSPDKEEAVKTNI